MSMDTLDDDSFYCIIENVCALKSKNVANACCVCKRMRIVITEILTCFHVKLTLLLFTRIRSTEEGIFKNYIKKNGLLVTSNGLILMRPRPRRRPLSR